LLITLTAIKTVAENPKEEGGQDDRIGGQDHRNLQII